MLLETFDPAAFLRLHWQQAPALIRNPWRNWHNPLAPDELAGLACEEGVESRLIVRKGEDITLENGPFPETRFAAIGRQPWTLLVQAVDHHVPDVAALIEPFRFIPDWRIDDVMVSYASDGGGVGPHFDQYDVFLVQGLGRRRWRVGPRCDADTPMLPNAELGLLPGFAATDEWILEPGDILYVPPGFAHDGEAVGDDCMTYSIGFRAPSQAELLEGWAGHLADHAPGDLFYTDPALTAQDNAGEILPSALDRLHDMVLQALTDRDEFARWFGIHSSTPKYPEMDWRPQEPMELAEVAARLRQSQLLQRNPASRFCYIREGDGAIALFVDGALYPCGPDLAALAQQICATPLITCDERQADHAATVDLIAELVNAGALAFDIED